MSADYSSALNRTRTTLNDLREGRMVELNAIQDLSTGFVKTFMKDRSILLNVAVIAKVIQATEGFHTRPAISVLTDPDANPLGEASIRHIDLSVEKNFHIVQALADTVRNEDIMKGF